MTSATPKLPGSVKNDLVTAGTAQHAYLKTGDHKEQCAIGRSAGF